MDRDTTELSLNNVKQNKQIFQKQIAFSEGESVGWMLAQLVRTNSPSSVVPVITTSEGRTFSHTPKIVDRFREYYEDLYSSRQEEMGEEMDNFFFF